MAAVIFGPSFVEAVVACGQGSVNADEVRAWTAPDALDQFLKAQKISKSTGLGSHFMSLVRVVELDEPGQAMRYDAGFANDDAIDGSIISMVFPVKDC